MPDLKDIVAYTDELLEVQRFNDYCPNGLQVQGRSEVKRIVGGVTASLELINTAVEHAADALLVHHGYFWKGEDATITGMKYERIRHLLDHGISLLAYHLPLDAHAEYGNNVGLARLLGLQPQGGFAEHNGIPIALSGQLDQAMSAQQFAGNIEAALGRAPLVVQGHGRDIHTVGWCTGAAQGYIDEAASLGLDAFISGEISEHTWHAARELGIDYFACGHHATERSGVQALGQHLSEQFSLEFEFVDLVNPV